ncbi:hypothetical protein EON79_17740 [bacterium]|nr:MAG: hypothetical protein EON79_17740 [bacterium]
MVRLRLWFFALGIAGSGLATATPAYLQTFLATYRVAGRLKEASCGTCHTQVPSRNAYGKSVLTALEAKGTMELTGELLHAIEAQDPDGDGASSGEEIGGNTLPGDPKSRPLKTASVKRPTPSLSVAPPSSPIPKHAFHPSLVHFPIALFLFGAALDLVGLARRKSIVRTAAIWNMTAGAIATALAIPTGFVAASLSGYAIAWGTAVTTHLLFALGGTALMTGLVAWRARGERGGPAYVALVIATIALVMWAGHLGGGLVYGE